VAGKGTTESDTSMAFVEDLKDVQVLVGLAKAAADFVDDAVVRIGCLERAIYVTSSCS
jgi:hypothetical protein